VKQQKPARRVTTAVALATVVLAGMTIGSRRVQADDNERGAAESKIRRGFDLAPVPLNLAGREPDLVGLGSFIVNAQTSCNDCHSAGPATQYAPGGNPFFGQLPDKTNPATYLGGGRSFGSLVPGSPEIVARNLTPDKTGLPVGGDDFAKFLLVMKTGADPDHVHPTCSSAAATSCLPPPFDGNLLQIMPWPVFRNMTNHELRAIYEYLSAIPCVEGGPGEPANRCH
jgi:hypothetical protein